MGTKTMTRGHGVNRLRCLRLVSGLDVKNVKDVLYKYDSVTAFIYSVSVISKPYQ